MILYDPNAVGSDAPRSFKQLISRVFSKFLVKLFRLNKGGGFSTEFIQQLNPVHGIKTGSGKMYCKGGHGRLRWRADTFYTEEPETIKWLDSITKGDYFWDIGANVGLYSLYVAINAKCRVLAIEPEAQNYSILIENVKLNHLQQYVEATNIPITKDSGIGKLHVHSLTKGGAYNYFHLKPESSEVLTGEEGLSPICQLQYGLSLDKLVDDYKFVCPTHIKIDVDGNEPDIISGASLILNNKTCKSILIEIQREKDEYLDSIDKINNSGFRCISEFYNRNSPASRSEHPSVNMIFIRD